MRFILTMRKLGVRAIFCSMLKELGLGVLMFSTGGKESIFLLLLVLPSSGRSMGS